MLRDTDALMDVKDYFKREIMPRVRASIKAHMAEYPDSFKAYARTQYLKSLMEDLIFDTFYLMNDYEVLANTDNIESRVYVGARIVENMEMVVKYQGQIIALRKRSQ